MSYNLRNPILITIIGLLMALVYGCGRPYGSQETPIKLTPTEIISPTRTPTRYPTPSSTTTEIQGYTIDQEAVEPMQYAIKIMFEGMQKSGKPLGVVYYYSDVVEAAYVLADISFGDGNSVITKVEAYKLLDHVREKYK